MVGPDVTNLTGVFVVVGDGVIAGVFVGFDVVVGGGVKVLEGIGVDLGGVVLVGFFVSVDNDVFEGSGMISVSF